MASASPALTLWPSSRCAFATLSATARTKCRNPSTSSGVALLSSSATAARRCSRPFSRSSSGERYLVWSAFGLAATIWSRSSLWPCMPRASTYALDIARVSRNIPPRAAVTTIRPAVGGASSTDLHSSGVNAALVVIAAPRVRSTYRETSAGGRTAHHPWRGVSVLDRPDSREQQRSLVGQGRGGSLVPMDTYDVAIVGGGAAGLSAALVLARARRKVLVVDAGSPRNAPAGHMHGFLSRDGLPPGELLALGRREVTAYGGEIRAGAVTGSAPHGGAGFHVVLDDGQRISGRRLLVSTGLRDELPDIPGLRERWARDVLHCPYCHGHEVRDRRLGVVGGGPGAVRYAQIVRQWTDDLVYFTPLDTLTGIERSQLAARSTGVVEGIVEQLVIEDDRLRGVQLDDGCVVPRDALFVPPRFVPNSRLLVDLGCEIDHDGWVTTDATGRTSIPGVWAAGNVVDPRAQVITAAGAGSAAAIALNADLTEDDVRDAVRAFNPDLGHDLRSWMGSWR